MDSKNLINDLREIRKFNDELILLTNGHWQVKDKTTILLKYTSFFFDSHIDIIKSIALKVLSEVHPMFDLKPEQRFAAAIHGKKPKYSAELRKGISETLAFLSIHGSKLKNCTQHKPEATSSLTIRGLFKNADWKLWASLNDLLPILAEAAPDEFLSSVLNTLKLSPCPFDELYSQEGTGGVVGVNYMTGLYWALETLAWSKEYLTSTIHVLAELAVHDPGGNWANRPANSITTILLPWMPQTTASIETRIAAINGIKRNFPNIAWKAIVNLLPNRRQTSNGSQKPLFQKFIPEDWKKEVSTTEYWEQVRAYANLAVEMAGGNVSYISELATNLDDIPQPAFDTFLDYLSSPEIVSLPDSEKQVIWSTIDKLVKKHRRFSDSDWALPKETVDLLQEIVKKMEPSDPYYLYQPLFSYRDFELMDDNLDWQTQQGNLFRQRIEAVKQIYNVNKTSSVISFAENVENSKLVGDAFAQIANSQIDAEILPSLLDATDQSIKQFISIYIWCRYSNLGNDWIEGLKAKTWSTKQQCALLFSLPFEEEIWTKANDLLEEQIDRYWLQVKPNPYPTRSSLVPAIENLLKYARPRLALDCIYAHNYSKKEFLKELAIKALIDGVKSEESMAQLDFHHVTEIIKMLQADSDIDEEDMFTIEWFYLPMLDNSYGAEPKLLEKRLSQKPEFFIEVIQSIYRAKNQLVEQKSDETKKNTAMNAWNLLHGWKRPPGTQDDGTFSAESLRAWYDEVKKMSNESGHLEVALEQLGQVLFYTGPDANGLWIHQSVAELLDEPENADMRRGFTLKVFNSRGAHSIDPSGQPERELADNWRKRAEAVEAFGLINFYSALKELADSYDREAERVISDFGTEDDRIDGANQ